MTVPAFSLRELLEAGVHFGHHPRRWNPKMKQYIFGVRNDVHIINLDRTSPLLSRALEAIRDTVAAGGRVLLVGTKKQASEQIAEAAQKTGQYYVNHRWLGGMMTNWKTVSNSITRLREIETNLEDEGFQQGLTKKELLSLQRQKDKLEKALGGIKDMGSVPDLLVVFDTNRETLAISEANCLNIPVVGILDTNSDPDGISYPVPGNDDARRSIELYCRLYVTAALDGLQAQMASVGVDAGSAIELDVEVSGAEAPVETVAGKPNVEVVKRKLAPKKPAAKTAEPKKEAAVKAETKAAEAPKKEAAVKAETETKASVEPKKEAAPAKEKASEDKVAPKVETEKATTEAKGSK
ncbi:MAG: 30S ribosomal protein S2 [bacterium]|nr:30S ribosomal protein S2 [bacterium]